MIELLGISLTYEAILFIGAFAASEVIGASKLKENSVAQLLKSFIDTLRGARKEDEQVVEVRKAAENLINKVKKLGGK